MIAAVVREADIHNRPIMITGGKVDSEIEGFAECVRITELLSRFPDSVSGRLEHALLNLAHISDSPGQWIAVDFTAADPRVFSLNMNESRFIVTSLAQMQLVTIAKQGNTSAELFVSAAGWNRINELEKGQSLRSRSQGFVAMWFGDDKVCDAFGGRTSEDFLFDAYRNGFSEGIARAGFSAMRIDLKDFIGDIVAEIMAEIRKSRFIVADCTGHRNGVYFEAGFALGLDIPLFLTCHKSEMERAHFDTNHFNHIVWKSPSDLADSLNKRIQGVIGQGPSTSK